MKIWQDRAEDLAAAEAEEASVAAEALAEAAVEAAASAVDFMADTMAVSTVGIIITTIIMAAFGFSGPGTITTVAAITEAVASAAFLA